MISTCAPTNEFLSEQEVLVTACDGSGGHKLIAMTTEGKILWDDLNPGDGDLAAADPIAKRPARYTGDARRYAPDQRLCPPEQ